MDLLKKTYLKIGYIISKFDFFMDFNSLLCIGGCFKYVDLNEDVKYFIILFKNSYVIFLLIR